MKLWNRTFSLLLTLCLLLGCAPLPVLAAETGDGGGTPKDLPPDLPGSIQVTVSCDVTSGHTHEPKVYSSAVTGTPVKNADGSWTVEASLDTEALLSQYNTDTGFCHHLTGGSAVTMTWQEGTWSPLTAALPVTCVTDQSHHVTLDWWDDGNAAARPDVTIKLMAGGSELQTCTLTEGELSAELPYGQLPAAPVSATIGIQDLYAVKKLTTTGDTTTAALVRQDEVAVKLDWKKGGTMAVDGYIGEIYFEINDIDDFTTYVFLPLYSAPGISIDYTNTIKMGENSGLLSAGSPYKNGDIYYIPAVLKKDRVPLKITGAAVADKIYDGTKTAKVTDIQFSGSSEPIAQGDDVTVLADAVFESPDAGENIKVNLINVRLGGRDAYLYSVPDNYQPGPEVNITGKIRKANPEVTAPTAAAPVYQKGTAQNLLSAEAAAEGLTFRYAVTAAGAAAPAADQFQTGIPQKENAGDYLVWYMTDGNINYNASAPASLAVTVQKADNGIKTVPTLSGVLTFDNTSQNFLTAAGEGDHGEMRYAVGNSATEEPAADQFRKDLPAATLPGTYHIWVKVLGTENYKDTAPTCMGAVTIKPRQLDAVTAQVVKNPVYTGDALLPEVIVKGGGMELVPGRDYILVSSDNVSTGKKTVAVQQKPGGCYTFPTLTGVEFTIQPKPVTPAVEIADAVYDFGREVKPAVTVKTGETVLQENRDYTLVYQNHVNAGGNTASVTVKPVQGSNYQVAETKKNFTIRSFPLTPVAELVEDPAHPWVYDGKAHTPEVRVKKDGTTLIPEEEYELVFQNNIHAGVNTASVEIKDAPGGNYEIQPVTLTFTIRPCEIVITPEPDQSKPYGRPDPADYKYRTSDGFAQTDRLKGSLQRTAGENPGEYAFSLGTLNHPDYRLTLAAESPKFKVTRNTLKTPTVVLSQTRYLEQEGVKRTPGVTVKDVFAGGETVADPSEYQVTYRNNEKQGTASVTITDAKPGAGNYDITETTVTFTIYASAEKAVIPAGNANATVDNVKTSDLSALKNQLQTIDQMLTVSGLSAEEKKTLEDGRDRIKTLVARAEEAQKAKDDTVAALGKVTPEVVEKFPGKLAAAQSAKADLQNLQKGKYKNNFSQEDLDQIQKAINTVDACTLTNIIMQCPLKKGDSANQPDDIGKRTQFVQLMKDLSDTVKAENITAQGKAMVSAGAKTKYIDLKNNLTYRVIKGKSQVFESNKPKDLEITANGALSKFDYLAVDGKKLDSSYYTKKSGSTIVTLKSSYLKTLKAGLHTVDFHYTDETIEDRASTVFTVRKYSTIPRTGDPFNLRLWMGLLIGSSLAVAAVMITAVVKKHKNHKKK